MFLAHLALIASGRDAAVTYTNPGARLELVMPELSKAVGRRLEVSPELRDIVVAVRLQGANSATALEKVAYAAWGMWRTDGDRLVLESDPASERAEAVRIAGEYRKIIHAMLAQFVGRLKADTKPGSLTPPEIAVAKLAPSLDEAALAAAPLGQELVYATKPHALQRPLPADAEAIFANMVAQLHKLHQKKGKPQLPGPPPYKTNLIIRRSTHPYDLRTPIGFGGLPGLDFEIDVYDAAGKAIVTENVFQSRPQAAGSGGIARIGVKPSQIAQSDLTKSLLRVWPGPYLPKPEMLERLAHPLVHDPAVWFGSLLIDYAASKNRQLVASLPDQATSDVSQMPTEALTDQFMEATLRDDGAALDAEWIAMRRRLPHPEDTETDWSVVDRRKLEALVANPPDPKLDPFSRLIEALRRGYDPGVALPQWSSLGLDEGEWQAAKTKLALLSDEQIRTLLAGGKVLVTETSPKFQHLVASELARGPLRIQTVFVPVFDISGLVLDRTRDARGEYTEVADAYLPPGAYIYLCLKGEFGHFIAAPGMGGTSPVTYKNPFPLGDLAVLAFTYCIKPGVNVQGEQFDMRKRR